MGFLTLREVATLTGETITAVRLATRQDRPKGPRALTVIRTEKRNGVLCKIVTKEEAVRWHNAKRGLTCDCCTIDRSDLTENIVCCGGQNLCRECKIMLRK